MLDFAALLMPFRFRRGGFQTARERSDLRSTAVWKPPFRWCHSREPSLAPALLGWLRVTGREETYSQTAPRLIRGKDAGARIRQSLFGATCTERAPRSSGARSQFHLKVS